VVALAEPATFTVEFVKKLVPVTSRLKAGPFAASAFTLVGVSEVIAGAAVTIVNVAGPPLTPPPGPGFETSTGTPPSKFTNAAGIVAVSVPPPPTTPAMSWPLKTRLAPFAKPEPVATRFVTCV
jgi:hypothetical protein